MHVRLSDVCYYYFMLHMSVMQCHCAFGYFVLQLQCADVVESSWVIDARLASPTQSVNAIVPCRVFKVSLDTYHLHTWRIMSLLCRRGPLRIH